MSLGPARVTGDGHDNAILSIIKVVNVGPILQKTLEKSENDSHHKGRNDKKIYREGSYHQHVCVGMCESAEVCHSILNERSKDETEADTQVDIYGLDEAVSIGQRCPGSHHQSGHGQYCGYS